MHRIIVQRDVKFKGSLFGAVILKKGQAHQGVSLKNKP